MVRSFHGKFLGLLANSATERAVRRQSRDGRAHLDTLEAQLLCREARTPVNRSPSWRQRRGPQPVNQTQNLSEQGSRYSDLRQLERVAAAMSPVRPVYPVSRHSGRIIRFLANYVRFNPKSGPGGGGSQESGYDPGFVKTIFWRSRRNNES